MALEPGFDSHETACGLFISELEHSDTPLHVLSKAHIQDSIYSFLGQNASDPAGYTAFCPLKMTLQDRDTMTLL